MRDGWLALGITLGLFLVLEGAARLYTTRDLWLGRRRPVASLPHPYASQPWWPELQRDLTERNNRFDPYRSHWGGPVSTRYVNVDSQGYRLTVGPPPAPGQRLVFMLGGSTMWGYTARDSMSIPSQTAELLAERGLRDVRVMNLAQAAYNSTQELNTLVLELAHGRVPTAAVFLDGYNDVASAAFLGEPGLTYSERQIEGTLALGRRNFWQELVGLGRYSVLIDRLQRFAGLTPAPPKVDASAEHLCGPTAAYFRNVARQAEALGRSYGFKVVYFLQPVHVTSGKPPSAWERQLYRPPQIGPCMASIDSAMAPEKGTTFFPLSHLFDSDTETVFIDKNAHITEAANRRVAEQIVNVLAPILGDERRP